MDLGLNKDQLELVNTAERVAREYLAPRAHQVDAAAVNPKESWDDVWRNGLLTIGVPMQYGGHGLDMPTYVMVIEKLAGGCTNTGMTVHMHSTVMRFIDALATGEQKSTRRWSKRASSLGVGAANRKPGAAQLCASPLSRRKAKDT